MKDRIRQIQTQMNFSQVQFSSETGISTATLSGIYTGRTQPTNAIISRIHTRFPEISISWLMFGEGNMMEAEGNEQKQSEGAQYDLFASADLSAADQGLPVSGAVQQSQNEANGSQNNHPQRQQQVASPVTIVKEVVKNVDKPQRRITEIRVFFDDGTYETYG